MRHRIQFTFVFLIASFILFFCWKIFNRKKDSNGFKRQIVKSVFQIEKTADLPSKSMYFTGNSLTQLYLKTLQQKGAKLMVTDFNLSNIDQLPLNIDLTNFQKNKTSLGMLDSLVYLVNNNSAELLRINNTTSNRIQLSKLKTRCSQIAPISKYSVVARQVTLIGNRPQRKLVLLDYKKNQITKTYNFTKKVDGMFDAGGYLIYNAESERVFYLFFLRGEFLCLDTNLSLQYIAKTIDTVKMAQLNIKKSNEITQKQKQSIWTIANRPKVVNRMLAIFKDKIFIYSGLTADNETISDFEANQIIDVYNLDKGKYLYSFYLPKFKGKHLQDFSVKKDAIFAVFENTLVKFKYIK